MSAEDTSTKTVAFAPFNGQKRRAIQKLTRLDGSEEPKVSYIYMIRTREFKLLNRHIYKLGKTTQEADTRIRRLTEYTRGSEVFVVEQVPPELVSLAEDKILAECRQKWNAGPDGSEYFEIPEGTVGILEAREIIHRVVMELCRGEVVTKY
jgi:hypothetical protein